MEDFNDKDKDNRQTNSLLEDFRRSMAKIKKESNDPHWPEICPKDLTEEDLSMWKQINDFKSGNHSQEEIDKIVEEFEDYSVRIQPTTQTSRMTFRALMANILQKILAENYQSKK
ncbi:MAG: hypothetical protein ACOCU8_02875 [Patescibacteria group bacterium]